MTGNQTITLNVETRATGKGAARGMRLEKRIPAVVYGPQLKENLNVSLAQLDAERFSTRSHENTIFTLDSEVKEAKGLKVLFKNVSRHPVSHTPTHIDLYAANMSAEIKVHVELKFEGKPKGAEEGGKLTVVKRDIEIEALPTAIPEAIVVDVTSLELNQSLHVSDIKIPSGVKVVTSPEDAIVTCATIAEDAPAEDAAADAAPAEEKK